MERLSKLAKTKNFINYAKFSQLLFNSLFSIFNSSDFGANLIKDRLKPISIYNKTIFQFKYLKIVVISQKK